MKLAVDSVVCAGGSHGPAEGTERFQYDTQTSPGRYTVQCIVYTGVQLTHS